MRQLRHGKLLLYELPNNFLEVIYMNIKGSQQKCKLHMNPLCKVVILA